jgi:BirA family biotin operon repressor/biotin-[acetyl-CoA-carboxylase] ligase
MLMAQLRHDCQLTVLDSVSSTNDEVLARAKHLVTSRKVVTSQGERAALSPVLVVSGEQTAGRGRFGRTWASPPGGLYLSLLLTLPAPPTDDSAAQDLSRLASLSPLAALASYVALQSFAAFPLSIKWPNDLISEKGKLVGILVETKMSSALDPSSAPEPTPAPAPAPEPTPADAPAPAFTPKPRGLDAGPIVVVGLGINVNRPEQGVPAPAAYLSDGAQAAYCREDIAAATVDSLLDYLDEWQRAGCSFAPFVAAYRKHMAYRGQALSVRDATGKLLARGQVEGIDDAARLLLATPDGTISLTAGEVSLRE